MVVFSQKEKKCSSSLLQDSPNSEVSRARYSGHNWLWHLGKFGGRNLALGKEGKIISMPQKLSFKLQICSGTLRVRISSKEENILKPQISNKEED